LNVQHEPPVLFCLHYLGGSGREFESVAQAAGRSFRFRPIDLAGFGSANAAEQFSVAAMVQSVTETIRSAQAPRWWLVGHSMGAKVATAIAAGIEQGIITLEGLESLALLAGSPPAPEPMEPAKRRQMLSWFRGDGPTSRAEGQQYIEQNTTHSLSAPLSKLAQQDLLRMNHAAWVAWLETGSREDWSERVGILQTPALLVAGSDDESLGTAVQKRLMAPHFSNQRLQVLDGATHLLPLEDPAAIARFLVEHAAALR
jgi:pimeloyl-ACP methyl ester carboxylesterase